MTALPNISTIYANILADLEAEFSVTLNPFGKAFLVAMAGVFSGLLWLIYLAIGDVQKNIWIDTCDYPTLLRYGKVILGRLPFAATPGQYTATATGTVAATIPGTTVYKADDTAENPGVLYQISAPFVMPGSAGTITINALAGGLASQLQVGDTLTAQAPIALVNSVITILAEVVTPIDAEGLEDYRTKCIEKIQLQPGSWSAVDYRLVGITVTGVEQTYAYATSGASAEVDVYLQGTIPGTPIAGGVITAYTTALELVLPLSVWDVHYYASAIKNVDVTITMGTFTAFTTAQKAAISAALTSFINGVHPFIASADDVVDRNDRIATFNLNSVITAAVNTGFSTVTFTVTGLGTVANWQADNGQIPFFNSVTYV